jgi:5-formyltetrahydrofolate cyclo-ligase
LKAVGFHEQIVERVPLEPFDFPIDEIVTLDAEEVSQMSHII